MLCRPPQRSASCAPRMLQITSEEQHPPPPRVTHASVCNFSIVRWISARNGPVSGVLATERFTLDHMQYAQASPRRKEAIFAFRSRPSAPILVFATGPTHASSCSSTVSGWVQGLDPVSLSAFRCVGGAEGSATSYNSARARLHGGAGQAGVRTAACRSEASVGRDRWHTAPLSTGV